MGVRHDVDTAVTLKVLKKFQMERSNWFLFKNNSEIVVQWNDIDPDFIKFQYDYRQPV